MLLRIIAYICGPLRKFFELTLKTKTMTKADLIRQIADETGVERVDVAQSVEALIAVVKKSLKGGQSIYLRGFGSFIIKKRAKKLARNISRGTTVEIPEHFVPSFKPSKQFIDLVRKGPKKTR
ncbi:MAG: HU family DNA-binding protein [Bacteroidia bacterium]